MIKRGLLLFLAFAFTAPFGHWAADRVPPQVRICGWSEANHGQVAWVDDKLCDAEPAEIKPGGTFVPIYEVTKRERGECPGEVFQEIVDSKRNVTPKDTKGVTARYFPHPKDPNRGVLVADPVEVPINAVPGRARFTVTTRRYCNWLQRRMAWPITQSGPDIDFVVPDIGQVPRPQ